MIAVLYAYGKRVLMDGLGDLERAALLWGGYRMTGAALVREALRRTGSNDLAATLVPRVDDFKGAS
jgi:hypothetical protein